MGGRRKGGQAMLPGSVPLGLRREERNHGGMVTVEARLGALAQLGEPINSQGGGGGGEG